MDVEDKSKDSSPASRKVPLEELSKEDLLKKYKSALLLAQKAKQAKDEAAEEIDKKKLFIKSLEEKCYSTEHELKKEIHHSKKIQDQLEATQELLSSQQKLHSETEVLVEERVAALTASVKSENAELLKELNLMNQVLKQRGELISKMTASHTDYTRHIDELEVSLSNTNKELLMKTAELESMADYMLQVAELKATLSAMSKDLQDKDKKIKTLIQSEKETEPLREELKLKVALIDQLQAANEEEKNQLLETLHEKEISLSQMQRELENFQEHMENISSEKDKELVSLKIELNAKSMELENCASLQGKINDLQGKLTDTAAEKDGTIEDLKKKNSLLKDQVEESNALINVQDEKQKFEEEAIMLRSQLVSHETQCRDVMEELKLRNARLEQVEMELASMNEQLIKETQRKDVLEQTIMKSELQLQSLEDSLSQEKNHSSELENSCLEKDQIIEDLQAKNKVIMTQSETSQTNIDMINSLEEKVSNLTTALQIKEKDVMNLQGDLQQKSESLSLCQKQLEEMNVHNSDILHNIQQQLQFTKKQEEEQALEVDNLRKSNDSYHSQIEEAQKNIQEKDAALISKHEEICKLNAELNMLNQSVVQMKDELEKKEEEIKSKNSYISGFCDDKNTILNEVTSLQSALTKAEADLTNSSKKHEDLISDLSKTNENIEAELKQLRNEFLELNSKKQEMADELCKLLTSVKDIESQRDSVQANYDAALVSEYELKKQLITLQETLQAKEASVLNLEQEVAKLKEGATHDTTNTEISSTYSMSQAEEQARLRDLEDSFEDKYTKLRVVAVKLKKRVSELTQTLESERNKMTTEKSEMQAKLAQLANHAKTTQTLQSEVDRLQDMLEEHKKCQQQLSKDLDGAVHDATAAKTQLATVQEQLQEVTQERNSLQAAKSTLESALSYAQALNSETDRLCKELREKELQLEQSNHEKKQLSEQLEKACADAKKRSVLSLEMEDMEKSVLELTQQLSSERALAKNISSELDQERALTSSIRDQLQKMEEIVQEKAQACLILEENLSSTRVEVEEYKNKCITQESLTKQLQAQLEAQQSVVESMNLQYSDLAAKQVQFSENAHKEREALRRQVFQLEEQCSALKESNCVSEAELAAVRSEFEGYKVRAQSVLRQSTRQEDRSVASRTIHDAEELELEVEQLRVTVNNLKTTHQKTTSQLEAALHEVGVEREEKSHALRLCQSLRDSCTLATERQHAAEEKLGAALEEAKQAKLHADMLKQCYKQQIEDLKTTHNKKVTSLTEQLEKLQMTMNATNFEVDQASSVLSRPSPVAEWASTSTTSVAPDPDVAIRMSSLTREEGEGSESIDSFPSRRISVTNQERRHELVPLDKLLSSSSYPDDEGSIGAELASSTQLNIDTLQTKLNACEARAAHLTALLSEAESDAARHSQLNTVLKEEIRRMQRSEERTQHAHNLEYLKNIVVKFITLQSGDERLRLVPVLNTILKLSPDESGLIASVAKGAPQTSPGNRGWGSYLPGWSGS